MDDASGKKTMQWLKWSLNAFMDILAVALAAA